MSGRIRAYGFAGAESLGSALGVGVTLQRESGIRLAPTLAGALAQSTKGEHGVGWPLRLFEVSVEGAEVLAADDLHVLARAVRVEREVPMEEALGPRAGD